MANNCSAVTLSEERAELERRVGQVDRVIDEAVYALYGLTDAERRPMAVQ